MQAFLTSPRLFNRSSRRRQPKYPALLDPVGRQINKTSDAHAARQTTIDRRLDNVGGEKRQRNRHRRRTLATLFAHGELLNVGDAAGDDFLKPSAAIGDGLQQCRPRLGGDRPTITVMGSEGRDDLARGSRRALTLPPKNVSQG